MEEKVKVIVYTDKGEMKETITDSFEGFQEIVKGNFEYVDLGFISGYKELRGYDLFCNELGKVKRLPVNKVFENDVIHGTFIISKADEMGNQISLTDEDCKFLRRTLSIL